MKLSPAMSKMRWHAEAHCGTMEYPAGLVRYWHEGNAEDSEDSTEGTVLSGATFAPGDMGQAFSEPARRPTC